jgi:hypothetical protein
MEDTRLADGVPLYGSRESLGGGEGPVLRPLDLPPSGGAAERVGAALGEFGHAGMALTAHLAHARNETEVSEATSKYLTRQEELERTFDKDKDYKTARARFDAQQKDLMRELGGDITAPGARQQAMLRWQMAGIAAGKRISAHGLGQEQDANLAALTVSVNSAERDAAAALPDSPERAAAINRAYSDIDRVVGAGWMKQKAGADAKIQFDRSVSHSDVIRDIRLDPVGTQGKLDDPNNYRALDPTTRENFKNAAANHADQVKQDYWLRIAQTSPMEARAGIEASGLQPHNYYRAMTAIDHVEKQNETALDKAAKLAASAAWTGDPVVEIIKQGYPVADERIQNLRNTLTQAAQRGDEKSVERLRELDLVSAMAPYVRQAWSMPIVDLDSGIKTLEQKMTAGGADVTQADTYALQAFKKVKDEITKRRNLEPIVLGGQGGARYYALGPLDPRAALDDGGVRDELTRRNAHAATANNQFGGNGSALTEEESKAFNQRWQAAGAEERFDMLKLFSATLPTKKVYEGTIGEVVGKDPAMAVIGRLAIERPELAREALRGIEILGSDTKTREKSALVRQELAAKVGGMIYPSPIMQDQAIDLAMAVHAARRGNAGQLYDPTATEGFQKALEDVTGPIQKINGVKVPITPAIANGEVPGVRAYDFTQAITRMTARDLELMGGAIDYNGKPIPLETLRSHAILRPLSIGGDRYTVELPAGEGKTKPVFTIGEQAGGQVLIFDMTRMTTGHKQGELERRAALPPTPGKVRARAYEAAAADIATRPDTGVSAPTVTPPPAPRPEPRPELPAPEPAPTPGYPSLEE